MHGFMVITNSPLSVAERFSDHSPQLVRCTPDFSVVFVPTHNRILQLEQMQQAVQGYIELFHSNKARSPSLDFFCNEEGMLNKLPILGVKLHHHPIHGDVLVCGGDENGDSVALELYDMTRALTHSTLFLNAPLNLETIATWVTQGNALTHPLLQSLATHANTLDARLKDVYGRL